MLLPLIMWYLSNSSYCINFDAAPTTLKNNNNLCVNNYLFADFEKLVVEEETIPIDMVKRFVKLPQSDDMFRNSTRFVGKFVSSKKGYKFFYIKQWNGEQAHSIFITYNLRNQQINIKKILTSCSICLGRKLDIYVGFGVNNDSFQLYYHTVRKEKSKPTFEELDIKKQELWKMNKDGYFFRYNPCWRR